MGADENTGPARGTVHTFEPPAVALTVGPSEVLVVTVPEDWPADVIEGLVDELIRVGLRDRAVVVQGDGLELAKVQR